MKHRLDKSHVAIVLQNLNGGGAERMMINLCGALGDLCEKVDLVLLTKGGDYTVRDLKNVNIIELNANRTLYALKALRHYIKTARPDVVLSALTHVNDLTILAAKTALQKTRVVVSERNMPSLDRSNPGLTNFFAYRAAPTLYKLADAVIAVSNGVANDVIKMYGLPNSKVFAVSNPVITPSLYDSAAETIPHHWLDDKSEPTIIAAGRLAKQKNYPNLLESFALLQKRLPSRLLILGQGPERDNLNELARSLKVSDRVEFFGFAPNPFALIKEAAVLALSSDWEGSPNILVEAMALGIPSVSTDCPSGPAEILQGGKLGRLVPCGDPKALADGLFETITSPPSREMLVVGAERYDATASAKNYLRIMLPNGFVE